MAGTVTTLAALDLGLAEYDAERTHGHVLSRDAVTEQTARLASLSVEERARIMEPGRAPVIVAGAAILAEIVERYGLDGIEASERDILHGAALAAAELPSPKRARAARRVHLLLTRTDILQPWRRRAPSLMDERVRIGRPSISASASSDIAVNTLRIAQLLEEDDGQEAEED